MLLNYVILLLYQSNYEELQYVCIVHGQTKRSTPDKNSTSMYRSSTNFVTSTGCKSNNLLHDNLRTSTKDNPSADGLPNSLEPNHVDETTTDHVTNKLTNRMNKFRTSYLERVASGSKLELRRLRSLRDGWWKQRTSSLSDDDGLDYGPVCLSRESLQSLRRSKRNRSVNFRPIETCLNNYVTTTREIQNNASETKADDISCAYVKPRGPCEKAKALAERKLTIAEWQVMATILDRPFILGLPCRNDTGLPHHSCDITNV